MANALQNDYEIISDSTYPVSRPWQEDPQGMSSVTLRTLLKEAVDDGKAARKETDRAIRASCEASSERHKANDIIMTEP